MSNAKAEEVNKKFIDTVMKRSGGGVLGLARNFRIIDKDRSGTLTFPEFKVALTKFQVPLNPDEMRILFDFYDRDKGGTVDFNEFMKGLRSKLSPQRKELTLQAFAVMDTDGSGEITFHDLKGRYDTSKHPKVLAKEWTHEQAINEFLKMFEGDSASINSVVTKDEWLDYHAGLSANIDEDDAYGLLMSANWGIKYVPKEVVDRIMKTIRTKAEQKGAGNKNPKRVAHDIFKYFDTNNTKTIDYEEFSKAMDSFGAGLDAKELKTFFGMFDSDGSGEISYDELLAAVFPNC